MKQINLLIILIILTACHSSEEKGNLQSDFKSFEGMELIKTYDIQLDNTSMILIHDSLLITKESVTKSFFCNIYNLNKENKITSFLSQGKGNNETLQALNIDFYNKDTIQVFSHPYKLSLFSITDLVKHGNNDAIKNIDFTKIDINPFTSMYAIDSKEYICCSENIEINKNARFCKYNSESNKFDFFGEFPKNDLNLEKLPIENNYRLYPYQGMFYIKPDKTKALFARHEGMGFDIVDLRTNNIICSKTYLYPDYYLEHISQFNINIVRMTDANITNSASTYSDKYVFMAYNNITVTNNSIVKEENNKSHILCFDWKGNPIKGYIIDDIVYAMALDTKNSYLYCVVGDESKNLVLRKYKYDI